MKRITLHHNGREHLKAVEVSDRKPGQLVVGEHVMLAVTGDCCTHKVFSEYVVTDVKPIDRFGGRDQVTFERVKRQRKEAAK